jgi:hypothetical protein
VINYELDNMNESELIERMIRILRDESKEEMEKIDRKIY